MSTLWTRSDKPCTAFFTELGSVTILMLALRTVHVLPSLTRYTRILSLSAISMEHSGEKPAAPNNTAIYKQNGEDRLLDARSLST